MPTFTLGEINIHFEEYGEGTPLLLIAPGGMRSAISMWSHGPWNPIETLQDHYRIIAMDQRNAGDSIAPVAVGDNWDTYTQDQLALMDHLGIAQFHVAGMCIGGPYILNLIKHAPERITSALVLQTIGRDENRDIFFAMYDMWADDLLAAKSDNFNPEAMASLRFNMFDNDLPLFCVEDAFVSECQTPMLVFAGNDVYHPNSSSKHLAALAPNAELIDDWKEGAAIAVGLNRAMQFLQAHS
jgi:pimeloyl-ACP methyl ester carboxylesterase